MMIGAIISFMAFNTQAEYTLKIKNGKYPDGVTTENLNSNIPDSLWYKRSWTKEGWSTGDYAKSTNVAVSPSHVADGVCGNALTLPVLTVEDGEWLSWNGCEVYPLFSDIYTVEFLPEGCETWIELGKFTESESSWSRHMIDMSQYSGLKGNIRFVCRSTEGYMLALTDISLRKPAENDLLAINHTPKFFAAGDLEEGNAMVEVAVMNAGAKIEGAVIGLTIGEDSVTSFIEDNAWQTGETRTYSLPLPLTPNVRADYKLTIEISGGEKQTLCESFAYCTSFKRYLYVDKGTGMWCNQCPTGTLTIEELEDTYGDSLIVGETHNGDPLADDTYFSFLKFYAIPYIMLNHIQTTKGENADRFERQICVPTEMEINISGLSVKGNGDLSVEAIVNTSEEFSDTDRNFRIGYMLTRNISGLENPGYYQKNICTLAKEKQYRYLPSRMSSRMCFFHDVKIPSPEATATENPAYTGIRESLPTTLGAGQSYDFAWDIPLPEGYSSFEGMRLVAFIIDSDTLYIINSKAEDIDELAGIDEVSACGMQRDGIFSIDGRKIVAERESLLPGLYIIDGKKVLIR